MLANLENFSRQFSKWLAMLGLIGLVALAMLTIADVMMRWLFSDPLDGISDLYRLLVALVVASFFPSAFAERGHISINFLSAVLPRGGRKAVAVLASLVTFGFTIIIGWQFILYCMEVYEAGETTWLLGINVTPWWIGVTALLLLCIPVQLIVLFVDMASDDAVSSGHGGEIVDTQPAQPADGSQTTQGTGA
ncbi:MAG: TRAP transporter small permease [Hyphomicrobiales bacterium]|nr:TRAP transporter small permease [Hyphomicrobiales bacterium]